MGSDERPTVEVARGSIVTSWILGLAIMVVVAGLLAGGQWFRASAWPTLVGKAPAALAKHPHALWLAFQLATLALFVAVQLPIMACVEVRIGRARFFEDRLELDKYVWNWELRGKRHVLPWSELAGFRDAHDSHVVLVRKTPRVFDRIRLSIPTPSSEKREVVVNELVRRGLASI